MAGYRPSNLTGATDWIGTLSQLKKALALGITERRISDEFFVFDLLKGVCEDGVDEGTRVDLLTFLEEHSHLLIDQDNVEQVLASLLDIFHQGRKRGASGSFTCQLLTTLITVLVEFEQLGKSVEVCGQIVTTLLRVISQVNDVTDLLLRSHALSCLLELEINYPTLLKNKLPSLYNLVKSEGSWLYQDYVQLFTKTLQHTLMALGGSVDSVTDSKLTDILCNRKEQLKECPDLQTPYFSRMSQRPKTEHKSFAPGLEAREIRQVVCLVTEQSILFTPSGLAAIIRSLVSVVGHLPSLSPIVFKPLVLQHLSTMDPCLLQLIMMLRRSFPGVLLSEVEEAALLQQFLSSLHHPGYTAAHRLMLYQWLLQYDNTLQTSESDSLPVRLTEQNYGDLFPSVFDGVDSQLVKLRALNLCIQPGPESDLASAVLMSSLVYLHKTVQHNSTGRASVALFRALYSFYKQHLHSCLPNDIKQFIIGLVSHSVQLVPHVINFLDALSQLPESSGVYLEILSALHRQVVQAATADVTSQLDYVLQALRKAATETQINPKSTLNFLSRLLRTAPQLLQGDWGYGNGVLAVARNILQYHSTDLIFHDMGGLFHSMMTHYGDVDVKDKARFYYALLTGAADEKIALVLTDPTAKNGTSTNNIQNIVTGPGGFLNQTTLTEVEKSPLCWNRLSQDNSWEPKLPETSEKKELSSEECVSSYQKQLQQHSPRLEYRFQLKMVDNCDFDQLLAITVQVETNSNWESVKDVHVSCLLASEEKEISLCLVPKLPHPASFPASVLFTSSDSRTYVSQLEPLCVGFSDFFLPLPLELCPQVGKKQFFYSLWHRIVEGDNTDDSSPDELGVQSVYIPGCEMTRIENVLQGKLKPFIIDSNPEEHAHLVGMLLPARYHLLMRIEQVEGRVVVNTATDLWASLTVIQTFLDTLSSPQSVHHLS